MLSETTGSWQALPLKRLRKQLEIYLLQMSNEREITCTRVLRTEANTHAREAL